MSLIVSTRGLYESTAATYQTSWEALVQHLATCARSIEPVKERVPLFNFAELSGGVRLEHVVAVHAGMLDYDGVTPEQLAQVVLAAQQFRGFAYTTHSHGLDGSSRFRVAVALDRPCPPQQWPHVWHRLGRTFGSFHKKAPDGQAKDAVRFYFMPAQNPAGPPCWFASWDGPLMSLDKLLEPDPYGGQELVIESELEQSERISLFDLGELAKKLARKSDSTLQMLGRALSCAIRGEEYAASGYRNDVTYKMAGEIGKAFPRADAEDLSEKLRASFELQGEPTPEAFAGMVRRQQLKHQQYEAERRAARQLRAPENTPATEDAPAPGEGPLPLVVQRAGHYWFRRTDSVNFDRVYGKDDVALAFVREFAGAVDVIGPDFKTIPVKQQLDMYGQVALRVEAAYTASQSTFDQRAKTLTLATAPRRNLAPEYRPEIARWLELMAGDAHEDLVAWIRALFDDRPLQALYLWGPKGTGKTLLPTALARLWEAPCTDFAVVLESFNAGLARNPLVLADEGFPRELTTIKLRSFLTTNSRAINEKYRPHFDLRGYVRLVVTANNPAAFAFKGTLEHEDAEATSERVVQVQTLSAAQKYLDSLGDVRSWVTDDLIAKHALWLISQPHEACPGRWAMQPKHGGGRAFQAHLVESKYAWFVAWLAGYLCNPQDVECRYKTPHHSWYVRTTEGRKLLISADAYRYIDRCEVDDFKKALRFFSYPDKVRLRVPGNSERRIWYYQVDLNRFFASATDHAGVEDFQRTISVDTEVRVNEGPELTHVRGLRVVK